VARAGRPGRPEDGTYTRDRWTTPPLPACYRSTGTRPRRAWSR